MECDFSTSPPANIIHHNREKRMYVNGKDAPGSYSISVSYIGGELKTIQQFINRAETCQQHLKYECKHSVITKCGWFKDGDGRNVKHYFPGGNERIGGCACYATKSCADKTSKYCMIKII